MYYKTTITRTKYHKIIQNTTEFNNTQHNKRRAKYYKSTTINTKQNKMKINKIEQNRTKQNK